MQAIVKKLVHRLPAIKIPAARSAIIWILGEFQNHASIALMAPDALRMLAKDFKSEDVSVKSQIVNLAAKLALRSSSVRKSLCRHRVVLAMRVCTHP